MLRLCLDPPPGIFKPCHAVVPPEPYFENCVYDLCATDGQVGALCQAIESYADMCASKGVVVRWRSSTFCRKFVFVLDFESLLKKKRMLQIGLICLYFPSLEMPHWQSIRPVRYRLSPTHLSGSGGPRRLLQPSLRGRLCVRPWPHPQRG